MHWLCFFSKLYFFHLYLLAFISLLVKKSGQKLKEEIMNFGVFTSYNYLKPIQKVCQGSG